MCGLAGFVGPGDQRDVLSMARALAHRGPDGEGFYADPEHPVFLGHRRLAIVDVEGGAQPMWNEDDSIAVVFNGEIYNHQELRRALEARGHRFRTDHSDTEVLVHGYEEWGETLPERLNGMFAFALWDRRRRRIFLARDRFGEKPLYWAQQGALFLFASELGALKQHRQFVVAVDRLSLMKLLAHGFIPAPNAFWERTRKLPAGAWLSYRLDDGGIEIGRYFRFAIEPGGDIPAPRAAEELRALIDRAVERRLMSDVPLGIFLSGGIDSSAIASAAARAQGGASIDSFAIGFREPSFDESAPARRMAEHLGTRHHEETLTMDSARDLVPDVLRRLDEPLGDGSLLPTFLLCGFARRYVTVALSGDGGDELFAGYDTFAALGPARLYRALVPPRIHRGLRRLANLLPLSGRNMSLDFRLRRVLAGVGHGPELWHPLWLAPLGPDAIGELLATPVDVEELYSEALAVWRESAAEDLVDRGMEFYTRLYLPDDILAKVDRASMMHSLEARAAFLDNDLVDFVRRLPPTLKLKGGVRKFVLKEALRGWVPDDILARPKKGFGVPLQDWLRALPYPGDRDFGVPVDLATVHRWDEEHRRGAADHRLFLWLWQVLQCHAP